MPLDYHKLQRRLRYGTQLHNDICEKIKQRRDYSWGKMANQRYHWDAADRQMIAYVKETEADQVREAKKANGFPQYVTIDIPYSYAIAMAAHTYWTTVFLGRSPILQYEGTSGEPENAIQAVQACMNYQVRMGRHLPNLYSWIYDVGKYGLGAMGTWWADEPRVVREVQEVQDTFLGQPLGTTSKQIIRRVLPGYKGSKLFNIRPSDLITDPTVSLGNAHDGEFMGWVDDVGWNKIARGAAVGNFFNVDVVAKMRASGQGLRYDGDSSVPRPYRADEKWKALEGSLGPTRIVNLYVDIIPRDWKLDDSSYPEKWVFVLANDEVLIGARPAGDFHGQFPIHLLQYEPDMHAMFNRGMLQLMQPLQDVLNWLINTHFYSVRSALNGMFIADPSRIVMSDLMNPEPWKRVRLKPSAYGTDLRQVFQQIQAQDPTGQHLQDSGMIADMIQRVTGVNDSIMGMVGSSKRQTATEVRTSSSFGINRLKTNAEYFSATGFVQYATVGLQMTQQYMDMAQKLRIAGDTMAHMGADAYMQVSPEDIQGQFDFVPVDGTMPVDRFAQVNLWTQLMAQLRNFPQIMQQYDMGRIFAWVAQLGGLRNIQQFRVNVSPDVQLDNQAQQGNVIPIGAAGGPGRESPGAGGRTRNPAQNAGMAVPR